MEEPVVDLLGHGLAEAPKRPHPAVTLPKGHDALLVLHGVHRVLSREVAHRAPPVPAGKAPPSPPLFSAAALGAYDAIARLPGLEH
jgi:hypothetical protein